MKRFLALALTLILAFSLSIPAAAASDDYWNGYYDGTGEGYDDGYADFEAGKPPAYPTADDYDGGHNNGYIHGYISGYESAQWEQEIYDSSDYRRGYEAGYADALAGETGYPDEYWENTAFEYGYDDGYIAGVENAGMRVDQDSLAAFGGAVGKVNVMLNGECIDFGDVWPENLDGRVMAPVRAVLEALGAQVDYDPETHTVTAELDGNLLVHQVGTASVEVYAAGDAAAEPQIVTMDCTSVISGGRTLVPVRFFSEALGFDVYWDGEYRTVVLIDRDFLPGLYDGNLTVVNLLLSNALSHQQPDAYYRQNTMLDLNVTVFDTLNGNTALGGSANLEAIYGQEGLDATLQLDLRKLFDALRAKYGNDADMRELATLLEQTRLDLRFDAATEQLYIGGDLLGALSGLDGAWYQEELAGSGAWTYGQNLTASSLVLQMVVADSDPVFYVNDAMEALEQLTAVLGDDCFTRSGSTYTYPSTAQEGPMKELLQGLGGYGYDSTSDFTLSVTDQGNGTCSYQVEAKFRTESMSLEFRADGTENGGTASCKLHIRNNFEAVLTADTTIQPTTTKPRTVPEDQEASLELEELPNFYM